MTFFSSILLGIVLAASVLGNGHVGSAQPGEIDVSQGPARFEQETTYIEEPLEDDSMGPLLIPMMIILVIFAAMILFGLGLTALLVLLGIVSSSVIIGFLRKRPGAAVGALVIQFGAVVGIVCGVVAFWLAKYLFDLGLAFWPLTLYGAICGLVFGVVIGVLLNFAWNRAYRWIIG